MKHSNFKEIKYWFVWPNASILSRKYFFPLVLAIFFQFGIAIYGQTNPITPTELSGCHNALFRKPLWANFGSVLKDYTWTVTRDPYSYYPDWLDDTWTDCFTSVLYLNGTVPEYETNKTFKVKVKATQGSTSYTVLCTINIKVPGVSFDPIPGACPNDSVEISPGTYSSYLWSTGDTTPTIYGKPGITYEVTITDVEGCTNSAQTTVDTLPTPALFNVIGNTYYPPGGDGVTIGLDNSQVDVLYQLLKNNIPDGDAKPGNDLPLGWTNRTTGLYTVMAVSQDNGCKAMMTGSVNVTNSVNHAPEIQSTAPTTAIIGSEYLYTVNAVDSDNDNLTYSLANAPDGLHIEENIISWVPVEGTTTSGEITLTVSDGSLSDTEIFTIAVSVPPVLIREVTMDWVAYPNPVSDILMIRFDGLKTPDLNIQIISMDGKVQITKQLIAPGIQTFPVDLRSLNNGLYYCRILSSDKIETFKVIKR